MSYRQALGRHIAFMPPLRVLARIVLVLLLLADGALGARAATLMLVEQAAADGVDAEHVMSHADIESSSDCPKHNSPPGSAHADDHCSCVGGTNCNCLLQFYPCGITLTFHLQRLSSPCLA